MASNDNHPIFALIIGIDNYIARDRGIRPLRGCINDAREFKRYLNNTLGVANAKIRYLEDTTRAHILKSFDEHFLKNNKIKKNDNPILIFYFSGHGGFIRASPDLSSDDGPMETICPVDDFTTDGNGLIPGIPAITLNAKLLQLADLKGDNILVILDCCHSGGATRDLESIPATTRLGVIDYGQPVRFPEKEKKIWRKYHEGASSSFRQHHSHVLLAACQYNELAYEHPERRAGIFTTALLHQLTRYNPPDRSLTYFDLVESLRPHVSTLLAEIGGHAPPSQFPTCWGSNKDRWLFGRDSRSQLCVEPALILGRGTSLGVTKDSRFILKVNSSTHRLAVHHVDHTSSVLKFDIAHSLGASALSFSDIRKLEVSRLHSAGRLGSTVLSSLNFSFIPKFVSRSLRSQRTYSTAATIENVSRGPNTNASELWGTHPRDAASRPRSRGTGTTTPAPEPVKAAFIVRVGTAHCVTKDSRFILPLQDNQHTIFSKVHLIEPQSSVLVLEDEAFEWYSQIPPNAKASWRGGPGDLSTLRVRLGPSANTNFRNELQSASIKYNFKLVNGPDYADIEISFDQERRLLKVKRFDPLIIELVGKSPGQSDDIIIPVRNGISLTLNHIAHFHYHLARSSGGRIEKLDTHREEIGLQLYELEYDGKGFRTMRDETDHFYPRSVNTRSSYGIRIFNMSQRYVYPTLFCFDPNTYEIKLYTKPNDQNDCLLDYYHDTSRMTGDRVHGRKEFTVGYGRGGGHPIKFSKGERVFFKLFASGDYCDLKFIEHDPVVAEARPSQVRPTEDAMFVGAWVVGAVVKD